MSAIRRKSAETLCMRPLSSLIANPCNARTHAKAQIRQIAELIEAIGFWNPILIDENGMVLAAAKLLKLDLVPTISIRPDGNRKRVLVLADNRIALSAGWDRDLLASELGDLAELLP